MTWSIKRKFRKLKLLVEIETSLNIKIHLYNLLLRLRTYNQTPNDIVSSKKFIAYALRFLPTNCFIIFCFDDSEYYFIQFCRLGKYIVIDLPVIPGNPYYGFEKECLSILGSMKLPKIIPLPNRKPRITKAIFTIPLKKKYYAIKAIFGTDYEKAAETTLLITMQIFKINSPKVFSCKGANLTGKRRS